MQLSCTGHCVTLLQKLIKNTEIWEQNTHTTVATRATVTNTNTVTITDMSTVIMSTNITMSMAD